jgi:DNA-binding response OmpR family regulator
MKKRLLLIEDTKALAEGIADVFAMEDFEVITASNGVEALKELEKRPKVDVVITDLVMPEMDGVTFIVEFRRRKEYDQIPVIVFSAKSMEETCRLDLDKAGANLVLSKSCDIEILINSVSNIILHRTDG